jgi:peptide/nickel transport system permease protein
MTRSAKIKFALGFLVIIHIGILLAGYIAPYPYDEQHRAHPYAAPSRIHFSGLRPVVSGHPVEFFTDGRLFRVREPGVLFLLGTDAYGRDVFSRLLYGGRISLLTGVLAAFVSLTLGIFFGTLAGYYGRWVDALLMRTSELIMALPWLYLLLGVRAAMPLHISPLRTFFLLIAIIGGVGWVRPGRIIRGVVLSARERAFVQAARGFGASNFYLIRRHVLPQTFGEYLTQATILIPQYMIAEVTLSFLGLGVSEPAPSWGNMLAEARQYHSLAAHGWLLAPALAIVPILFGYLTLADSLVKDSTSS